MGKFHSKHGDCYINVNTHINSMLSSDSECSHQPLINDDSDTTSKDYTEIHVPLQVVLPPVIGDKLSDADNMNVSSSTERKDVHTDTDTTDNNVPLNRSSTLQEFECGLSVQSTHLEKQEWSFTLYDFDGRGRVTKEDLGQLLKSLYDAVGSTISLPPEGTKSLKLRLTVSPDQTKLQQKTTSLPVAAPDLNRKECNRDKEQKHTPKKDINSKLNNGLTASPQQKRINAEETPASQPRVELRNNLSKAHRGRHKQSSPSKRLSTADHHLSTDHAQHDTQHGAQHNVQHSTQQGRQKQQKVRRHHSEIATTQTSIHHTPKRSNQGEAHVTASLENPDRRNYYLDLAGIENHATTSLLNTSLPEPVAEASASSPQKIRGVKSRCKQCVDRHGKKLEANSDRHEKRTKSGNSVNDLAQPVPEVNQLLAGVGEISLMEASGAATQHDAEAEKTPKPHAGQTSQNTSPAKGNRRTKRQGANCVAATLSPLPRTAQVGADMAENPPAHRRHKPRDKNHIRAMQQVADWIEKEHTRHCEGAPVIIERHEHHHIHEHHHHHHYHHYHGT